MLDSWSLRVLVAVADHGSFSAAADGLSLTQPAVSRQIGALERRLGTTLFRRVPRGVAPTPAGSVAIDQAREVLAAIGAFETRLTALANVEAGELRLSAFPSANTHLVPEAIRRFSRAHPGVAVSLLQADPETPWAAVREGQVDIALVTSWHLADLPGGFDEPPVVDGVEFHPLLDEELRLALKADHRLSARRRVPLAELQQEAWIDGAHPDCLGPLSRLTEALGAPPRVAFWCDDWNGKHALVAAGLGVALVPALAHRTVRAGVVVRQTTPTLPGRRLYAVTADAPYRPSVVSAMMPIIAGVLARG